MTKPIPSTPEIQENVLLKDRTTFRIGGTARWFAEVSAVDELRRAIDFAEQRGVPVFLLGGGSNLLVSDQGFPGLVIAMVFQGMEIIREDETDVVIRVAAGESWDAFIAHAVEQGWWGIENMSLIPGTVGAVPIQNVGAYGQDASQVICEVEVLDRTSKEIRRIPAEECGFAYRRSVFNREAKGRYAVLNVIFRLRKNGSPNLSHSAVRALACVSPANSPDLRRMREIIIHLREDGRLADPEVLGNAGSFFQSPVVPSGQLKEVKQVLNSRLSEAEIDSLFDRGYETDGGIKIPAAELIRAAGTERCSVGGAALYSNNPAIVVNRTGAASAADVLEVVRTVRKAVLDLSGLLLPVEPEAVGFESTELNRLLGA